jgi:hypothetical protein
MGSKQTAGQAICWGGTGYKKNDVKQLNYYTDQQQSPRFYKNTACYSVVYIRIFPDPDLDLSSQIVRIWIRIPHCPVFNYVPTSYINTLLLKRCCSLISNPKGAKLMSRMASKSPTINRFLLSKFSNRLSTWHKLKILLGIFTFFYAVDSTLPK